MARRRSAFVPLLALLLAAAVAGQPFLTRRDRAAPAAQDTAWQVSVGSNKQSATMNPLPLDSFPYGPMIQAQQQEQEAREQEHSPYPPTPPPEAARPPAPTDSAPAIQQPAAGQQPAGSNPGQSSPTGSSVPSPTNAADPAVNAPSPDAPPAVMTKEELYLKDAEMCGFYFYEPDDGPVAASPGATSPADMALPIDGSNGAGADGGYGRRALTPKHQEQEPDEKETTMHTETGEAVPFEIDDPVFEVMRGSGRSGDSAALALKSVAAAAHSLARQGVAAAERHAGVGAGTIASPAVLAVPHPVLGVSRAVFVGFKRIGALNVDFNLPVSAYDRFGTSCAVLLPQGDLDHDPTSVELAVGAPGDHTYQKNNGAVYIIFLASFGTMVRNYHKIIPGEGALSGQCFANTGFGTAVTSLGDLNGDGYADIAVGAPFQDKTGVVFILFLGYGGVVASYTKISAFFGNPAFGNPTYKSPLTIGDEFGCSIANIGDLNRDGIPDLAVGACGDTDVKGKLDGKGCFAAGAVYILFMNTDGTVKYHRKISAKSGNLIIGPQPGDRFGASIAVLGDCNNDGNPEIAVGSPLANASGRQVGQVYILELLPSGDVKRFEIMSTAYTPNAVGPYSQYMYLSAPLASHDYLGSSVAACDIDRDGIPDLLVGARGYNQRAQDEGAALVCYLERNGMALAGWEQAASQGGIMVPVMPGEQFGASIAVLDDPSRSPSFSLLFVGAPGECGDAAGGSLYVLRVQPIVG